MNKYQEAINELYKQRSERYKVFQKHEKWNEEIKEYDKVGYCLQTLEELVDKEKPIKPIRKGKLNWCHCPCCDKSLYFENQPRCQDCGQKLGWGDDDE